MKHMPSIVPLAVFIPFMLRTQTQIKGVKFINAKHDGDPPTWFEW